MAFLRKYVRKYGVGFAVSVAFVMLEALVDLAQPTLLAHMVDVGVARGDMGSVLRIGGWMLIVTAAGALAASVRNVVSSRVSQAFGTELRADLFRKIVRLPLSELNRFDRASLVTRLTNDVSQLQMFVNGLMRIFTKGPLLCIGSVIMAIRLNPRLSLVVFAVVPIVLALIALSMKIGFPRFARVQEALDRVGAAVREYLGGVRVVRAFGRHDEEERKFAEVNAGYRRAAVAAARTAALFHPAVVLTVQFGIVAVLWISGAGVEDGSVRPGETIAFVQYMTQILFALMTLFMVFAMFVRAKASAVRIGEVLAAEEDVVGTEPVPDKMGLRGRIDFENVSFSYEGPGGPPAIRNVTFSCLPGETVGIVGPTGSGKSTLVSLIPRLYDATSGTVRVGGVDVRRLDPAALREKIAFVPQKTVLFSGTILDNIRMGRPDATEEEAEIAARSAQAHAFVAALPERYGAVVGQRGVNLSGGQKQRLAIARALVRKADILIFDDCTSAVDAVTEAKIRASLKEVCRGVTSLIVAQRISSVVHADKIVVLDRGEVVGVGKHEVLLSTCRVYREMWESQTGREMAVDV
ncbi:MAG: ABC transporter [Candidatus Reconcilbacillus cellulovorans]|uniref:ABC transporter n=1 Tax=Candidatus Reconcilbacillus cellulovorans TaxID=1906605 RepID=A0A2A6DXW3_9BACL|nr:MAG: ABC transporter [Candidatus Reconcilbacillus cellulovorans]